LEGHIWLQRVASSIDPVVAFAGRCSWVVAAGHHSGAAEVAGSGNLPDAGPDHVDSS